MDELLVKINEFWNSHEATEEDEGRHWFPSSPDEQSFVDYIWDYLFIGSHWNYETKEFLAKHGYRCWIGDGDSFGILVAVITKDGKNLSIG